MNSITIIKNHIEKMQFIHENIIKYITDDNCSNKVFENIINFLNNNKIKNTRIDLQSILHLLIKVSNNHHRNSSLYPKIENLILLFKEDMKCFFTNYEIFQIFKSNKLLLLFLFKEKIINPDKSIALALMSTKYQQEFYPHFFLNEFRSFYDEFFVNSLIQACKEPANDQKREIGENDHLICELIRKDCVEDFKKFVDQNKISLSSQTKSSIYETNSFLLNKNPSLIEYSAFFGSVNILKYLNSNGIQLTSSLWNFAAHGNNKDIINFLVQNKINPENDSFDTVYIETIKCHHIELSKIIQSKTSNNNFFPHILKYYNFLLFPNDIKIFEPNTICYLCKYNYFYIVKELLMIDNIPINSEII